ncbi:MAG: VOC family protein [Ignavibacteriae bacterium]|nr:MAG: VOC family protein [Ignavibacteriota bacterium]
MLYPDAINWFEIPSENFERAVKFYSALYDTELRTTQMDTGGELPMPMAYLPRGEGVGERGVGGAVIYLPDHKPGMKGPLLYLNGGEDLRVMLDRIVPAGGQILVTKTLITKEIGYYAIFIDSEGNHMALHSDH